ncbi:centromere-associated protein E [Pelodytes ibericus]
MSEGDAVKVCVRVRPLIQREQGDQVNLLWKAGKSTISQVDGTKSFNFDRVFHSDETTSQVYQETAVPIIRSVLQGYNGTIFAYGQTSSGKTYTMMGTTNSLGIIPQAVQEVFKIIREIPNREFLLRVSYMEIYNETVTDLLCDDRKKKPLEVREDINRTVYVADLTEELVMIPEHVMQWIKKGEKNRHYGETKMNEHSSRSHTIFRMIIESRERNDPGNSESCEGAVMVSHLNLVDLAGSERASQTGAEGVRLKEGCNINRSLFILGQVIKKLSDGQAGGFINYRDSKLTRILQNSLGGNARTLIICTVTPVSFDETLSTLQFASTAKHVRNTPHVNEVLDDQALLKRYRKEIMDLKKQLEGLEASSEVKAKAMAKEEHSQLLEEIKLLQKEREQRIWNLTNIVVASSQECEQDQRAKRKRRVTWAPGKVQQNFCSSGFPDFDIASKTALQFNKRPKLFDMTSLTEIDDSVCTEFSDFDDPSRAFDELGPESEWNVSSKVTWREKSSRCHSMIDFASEAKEMEQKLAELETQLKKVTQDYEAEAKGRESLGNEIATMQHQLQMKEEEKNELVKSFELTITTLENKLHLTVENHEPVKTVSDSAVGEELQSNENDTPEKSLVACPTLDQQENITGDKALSSDHDTCQEQIKMLEQKIVDLEEIIENITKQGKQDEGKAHTEDIMESIQLCEALMNENGNAQEKLILMRSNFDTVVLENERLNREIAELEQRLHEKSETSEFEMLEKETQEEHEAQLIHEIVSLKKVVENAELYNQDLETELESKSKLLKDQEKEILELKKSTDNLQRKVRNMDLSASMGDGEKLCDEVFQLKQSLKDAEAVTRDAQKESAFLRSENLELKERMVELSSCSQQKEKDAAFYEKQLESEKTKYKTMQADLQKELQCAFNEINNLNGLMDGKVPKDLLSRVELEKEVDKYSKQLEKVVEEKSILEKEVALLSEYKSLPSEVNQKSEELQGLNNKQEQSESVISNQDRNLQEQIEQIRKLTDEVTRVQSELQQSEEKYSELKHLHDELEESSLLKKEEMIQKQSEAEHLLQEVEQLKCTLLSVVQERDQAVTDRERLRQDKEDLIEANQTVFTTKEDKESQVTVPLHNLDEFKALIKEKDEMQMSIESERDNLKEQVSNLSSKIEILQAQTNKESEEKQAYEERQCTLFSEIEQLQGYLKETKASLTVLQAEKLDDYQKLIEIQRDFEMVQQQRGELQHGLEKLKDERDHLKQDLNENIELSIETQDELRSAQEELKYQKQLVSDLQRRLEDAFAKISSQVSGQESSLEKENLHDELNLISENNQSLNGNVTLQQLQEKLVAVTHEKDELQEILENLRTERDQLKCDLQENIEMSIETQDELRSALEELKNKTQMLDDLKSRLNNPNDHVGNLEEEMELKVFQFEEQLNALTVERDTLLVELKTITDQKLELDKQVSILAGERDVLQKKCEDVYQYSTIAEQLQENEAKYQELHHEKHTLESAHQSLISEMELLHERINAAESALEKAEGEKIMAVEKLYSLEEQMQSASCENNEAENIKESLQEDGDMLGGGEMEGNLKQEEPLSSAEQIKPDCELFSMTLEEEIDERHQLQGQLEEKNKKLEEQEVQMNNLFEKLKETDSEYEKTVEKLESVIRERDQLLVRFKGELRSCGQGNVSCAEDEFHGHQNVLSNETEDLEEPVKVADMSSVGHCEEGIVLNEMNAFEPSISDHYPGEMEIYENEDSDVKLLRESLQSSQVVLESIQLEKLQLTNKLNNLQQELDNGECQKGELQSKLESLMGENLHLKENLEILSKSSVEMQDELRKTQEELMQKIHLVDDLKMQNADQSLTTQEAQITAEFLVYSEEKVMSLKEELQQNNPEEQQEELVEAEARLQYQVENLLQNLEDVQASLEALQREKTETEQELQTIQQHMEAVSLERDELKTTREKLLYEQEKLKEDLHKSTEMVVYCKNELAQKVTEEQQMVNERQALEESLEKCKDELAQLISSVTDKQTTLQNLQQDKHNMAQNIVDLQQQMEMLAQEKDELKITQEKLISERDQLTKDLKENVEMIDHLKNNVQRKATEGHEIIKEEDELEKVQQECKDEVGKNMNLEDTEAALQILQQNKHEMKQKHLDLQQQMETLLQEKIALQITQEALISEKDQLKQDLEQNIEMIVDFKNELHKKNAEGQQMVHDREQLELSEQRLKDEVDHLMNSLKASEAAFKTVQQGNLEAEQRLLNIQEQMDVLVQERDNLNITVESLISERDQLKEQLKDNLEMVVKFQNELQEKTREDEQIVLEKEQLMKSMMDTEETLEILQQEKLNTEQKLLNLQQQMETLTQELHEQRCTMESLMYERDQLKAELQENVEMVVHCKNELEQKLAADQQRESQVELAQQRYEEEVECLKNGMKDVEASLQTLQQDKLEQEQKCIELQRQMEILVQERNELKLMQESLISERDQLKEDLQENVGLSIETQNDLRLAQEELQQQTSRAEQLTDQISALKDKLASVEKELLRHEMVINETLSDKEVLNRSKQQIDSEMKQLSQALQTKDMVLAKVQEERDEGAKRLLDLKEEINTMCEERAQLRNEKETLQIEVNKLNNKLEYLRNQHDLIQKQHDEECNKMEELNIKIQELNTDLENQNAAAQVLATQRDNLEKKVQDQDLTISNLYQDQEQCQQVVQRLRTEKENLYSELQDQEKKLKEEVKKCQEELHSIKLQKEELRQESAKKQKMVDDMLEDMTSKSIQVSQLQKALTDEKLKNVKLYDEIDDKDKEILLLQLKESEIPEVDEVTERRDLLENKTQEIMDLMENVSVAYLDNYSLLDNLSGEIQNEHETHKPFMRHVKESLSSAQSRAFGSLQTEHQKIHSQLQTVLNKFKIMYRNATVKEEQYSLIKDYEKDLIAEQKKQDELELEIQNLERHGSKWSETAPSELQYCELEFLNKLMITKCELIKYVEDDFSGIRNVLNSVTVVLQEEIKRNKNFSVWLDQFKGPSFDAKTLNDSIKEENKRLLGTIQMLTQQLKTIVQSNIHREVTRYLKQLEADLGEKRTKNKELLKRVKSLAPSGNMDALEEKNAQLQEHIKSLQAEVKKMQSKIKKLEDELEAAKADVKQKEEVCLSLKSKLLSNTEEAELVQMQLKLTEKEHKLQTALDNIQNLQNKMAKGAKPYQDEIDNLKTNIVKIEMEKMKLSKSTDQEIVSLKSCIDDKEECLRKLKAQLRRTQKDSDASVCIDTARASYSSFPLTCGGGSGIVQSTAMLVLQSEKAALERELTLYKKKWHQISKNVSCREEKKKASETPASHLSISHQSQRVSSSIKMESQKPAQVSPTRSEVANLYMDSPGKTGMHRKRVGSPCKVETSKRVPLSPSKIERHTVPAASPNKTGILKKTAKSPSQTDSLLLSTLTVSPHKQKNLLSPKNKFFDSRSKSLPYCPTRFFDNSQLGSLPDIKNMEAAAEESQSEEWWYGKNKAETANECKTS